jgi:hypothetical protein
LPDGIQSQKKNDAFRIGRRGDTPPLPVGDWNGDGNPDLAVACAKTYTVSILYGKGDGTFLPQQEYLAGSGPAGVVAGGFHEKWQA